MVLALSLAACAAGAPVTAPQQGPPEAWSLPDGPPARIDIDLDAIPDAVPRPEPPAERGNPLYYEVFGRRYFVMDSAEGYVDRGIASWYGSRFHGRETSSGEHYDMFAMTAAHRELPLPTYARVTNLESGRSVVVRINDRGPFAHNRLIDLSYAAAVRLDIVDRGTGLVEVEALDPYIPAPRTGVTRPGEGVPLLYLQVGAFSQRENAEAVVARLRHANIYNVEMFTRDDEPLRLWRVRVGPMSRVEDVDDKDVRLSEAGFTESRVIIEQVKQ